MNEVRGVKKRSSLNILAGIIVLILLLTSFSQATIRPEIIQFKDVKFSHLKHGTRAAKCTTCHPKIFKMKLGANEMKMSQMYDGQFCGKCHNGKDASDIRNCATCHSNLKMQGKITWPTPILGTVAFSHTTHLRDKSLSCKSCHPNPFTMKAHTAQLKMRNLYDGLYCGKCHNGRKSFSLNQCYRCHERVGIHGGYNRDGIISYPGPTMGKTNFSHFTHGKFSCQKCHEETFKMKGGSTRITMERMNRGENCGICHNGANAFSAGDCIRCHKNAPAPDLSYQEPRSGTVLFSHRAHFKKGYQCQECHDKLFKMKKGSTRLDMESLSKGRGCAACHNGSRAFSLSFCDKCHQGHDLETFKYPGKPLTDVNFSHRSHFTRSSTCSACHPGIFLEEKGKNDISMETMGQGKKCGACHNGVITFSAAKCDLCHVGSSAEKFVYEEKTAGNITFPHGDHYRRDGSCKSCHPAVFAPKKGENAMTMENMGQEKYCGTCHNGTKAFGLKGCSLCHDPSTASGGGDILFPGPTTGDVTFSHANHAAMGMVCQNCHDELFLRKKGASHIKMDEILQGKFCSACHNGTKATAVTDCSYCHHKK